MSHGVRGKDCCTSFVFHAWLRFKPTPPGWTLDMVQQLTAIKYEL
uniref:Uncharacterized protein n=1 Tax=Anguilla anguilla TaxID=7936 RepID=A0A0E9SJW2_ANGAN